LAAAAAIGIDTSRPLVTSISCAGFTVNLRESQAIQRSASGIAGFFYLVQCVAPERTGCSGAAAACRIGEAQPPTHALVRFAGATWHNRIEDM
jgi:hypothetical protein